MQIALFDDSRREHLLPLTLTRPVAMLRVGATTIKEKWERALGSSCMFHTVQYLRSKYPLPSTNEPCLMINGGILPSPLVVELIKTLSVGQAVVHNNTLIATVLQSPSNPFDPNSINFKKVHLIEDKPLEIYHPWHIFLINGEALLEDFRAITQGRESQPIPSSNRVINPNHVFIERGATVECAILNAQRGPIYIGANAEVMEGSIIRGPFALCEHSAIKMGAKIYGPTTIGPHSKVGGEVNNCVIQGYSNKAHDGYLGNSVLGEWCNLGADTNSSNLKNNYALVKLWSYAHKRFVSTGLQFCGLIMGDHSKCGINTMFNTGTVVGVSANIYGGGFPRNFIPSFSWGGAQGFSPYGINLALDTCRKVYERRGLILTTEDEEILRHIYREEGLGGAH